uniref:Uncharacterized protein n=1 Tax=Panagrolaimus davidi TaxID=227884 RepID=A0A914PVN5_9BILA
MSGRKNGLAADGIAGGANEIAGNVSPPLDSDESDSSKSSGKPNLAPVNQFFMTSLSYNFSKKEYLRGKRVNA